MPHIELKQKSDEIPKNCPKDLLFIPKKKKKKNRNVSDEDGMLKDIDDIQSNSSYASSCSSNSAARQGMGQISVE